MRHGSNEIRQLLPRRYCPLFGPGEGLTAEARRIAEPAAKSRLPAMYPLRLHVEAGGLISYGTDIVEVWRRAAAFVDKIPREPR